MKVLYFPKFSLGQIVYHRKFGYRGVIFKVDAKYSGTDDWYNIMAISSPPKEMPWYHVLVHNSSYSTYVTEYNLCTDSISKPVKHPLLIKYFERYFNGRYAKKIEHTHIHWLKY